MKELKDAEISPDVEKSIGEIVDGDIQKVVQEEGDVEKEMPKLFGLSLGRIMRIRKKKGDAVA